MLMARHRRSERAASAREARRLGTLERRYDFHFGEAILAALRGSRDKATAHSRTALLISRELYADAPDPARHLPELAAALCQHSRYGSTVQALTLLTESAGHYAVLARSDPDRYEVPRIDVLTRVALASEAAGNATDAISLLREVIDMYLKAPAADPAERDLGLARARFHLGRCLLNTGSADDALAETDAGLALADNVLRRLELQAAGEDWVRTAPRYMQLAVPDCAAAAVRSMTLHADAGRWDAAAVAARAAVRLTGGLASLGDEALFATHEAIRARADAIWLRAGQQRAGYNAACSM